MKYVSHVKAQNWQGHSLKFVADVVVLGFKLLSKALSLLNQFALNVKEMEMLFEMHVQHAKVVALNQMKSEIRLKYQKV